LGEKTRPNVCFDEEEEGWTDLAQAPVHGEQQVVREIEKTVKLRGQLFRCELMSRKRRDRKVKGPGGQTLAELADEGHAREELTHRESMHPHGRCGLSVGCRRLLTR